MTGELGADIDMAPLPLEIAPDVLAALQQTEKAYVILDVREAWELDICRLKDCLHIPMGDLSNRLDELPRDRPIFVVCHSGRRSLMATQFLREAGLAKAANLIGGVDAWAMTVDPSMPRY